MAGIVIHGAGAAAGAGIFGAGLAGTADGMQVRQEMEAKTQQMAQNREKMELIRKQGEMEMEQMRLQSEKEKLSTDRDEQDRLYLLAQYLAPDDYWNASDDQKRFANGASTDGLRLMVEDAEDERAEAKHKVQSGKVGEMMAQLNAPIGPSGESINGDFHPMVGEFARKASEAAALFYSGGTTFEEFQETFQDAQRGQEEAQAQIREKEAFTAAWTAKRNSLDIGPDGELRYADPDARHFMTDVWNGVMSGDITAKNGSHLMDMGAAGFEAALSEAKRRSTPGGALGGGSLAGQAGQQRPGVTGTGQDVPMPEAPLPKPAAKVDLWSSDEGPRLGRVRLARDLVKFAKEGRPDAIEALLSDQGLTEDQENKIIKALGAELSENPDEPSGDSFLRALTAKPKKGLGVQAQRRGGGEPITAEDLGLGRIIRAVEEGNKPATRTQTEKVRKGIESARASIDAMPDGAEKLKAMKKLEEQIAAWERSKDK